jgi:hypothetical protein
MSRRFFIIGFCLGFVLFIAANIYSYNVAEPPCCDFSIAFGTPLPLGRVGGFVGGTHFIPLGVIANIIIGIVASVGFAWMFARSVPAIIDRFQQALSWHLKTRS